MTNLSFKLKTFAYIILIFFMISSIPISQCMDSQSIEERMEQDLLDEVRCQAALQRIELLYNNMPQNNRISMLPQLLQNNPTIDAVLDVNYIEPQNIWDRLRPFNAFILWMSATLLMYLIFRYGVDITQWLQESLFSLPELVLRLSDPISFANYLHALPQNPDNARKILRILRILEQFHRNTIGTASM